MAIESLSLYKWNCSSTKWIGAAPVYDSGSSLWYNDVTSSIPFAEVICKPFKRKHSEQLKLVSSFDWFDLTKLDGIENEILDILCDPFLLRAIELWYLNIPQFHSSEFMFFVKRFFRISSSFLKSQHLLTRFLDLSGVRVTKLYSLFAFFLMLSAFSLHQSS